MRQNRMITEINENEICQKILINSIHEVEMRMALSVINKNERDKSRSLGSVALLV